MSICYDGYVANNNNNTFFAGERIDEEGADHAEVGPGQEQDDQH